MPHFRVDDGLDSHPKAERAGDEALGMWLRAGSWCMRYLTDGFVPDWWVRKQPKGFAKAKKLVAAGLWHDGAEREGEKGYQFHEFVGPGRQDSREKVEADRELARLRKQKSRRESRQESRVESHRDTPELGDGNQPETGVKNSDTKGTTHAVHNAIQSTNGAQKPGHEINGQNSSTSTDTPMSRRDSHRPSQGESRRSPGYTQPNPTQPISTSVESSHGGVTQVDAREAPSPHCPRHPGGTDKPCHACGVANDARKAFDARQARARGQRRADFWAEVRPAPCCDPNGMTEDRGRARRCPNHDWSQLDD